ncbi:glycoside hydrolase family 5 protein [Brachybacterium vulturis]|uniref:glycoside hydrolase family 5 protein n=1 Tax=Brachybacterium vulturis TaxID=2017484 RepID=UPI00373643CF
MSLSTEGSTLVDEHGRQRILHGINLVAKGSPGATDPSAFRGGWTAADLAQLRELGLDSVRLGVNWSATEPRPGEYSPEHLDWLAQQLDLLHAAGLAVILDGHQDLFSQSFGNGAPAWATLTAQRFEATALWSDAYLSSPAVHEACDAFWADAPAADGVGIRTRFVAMWGMLAQRFAAHPAVIGYDVLNEPTPGSAAPQLFGAIIHVFAELTGQDPEEVRADFADPAAKLSQLAQLEDPSLHRALGDRVAPMLAEFEQGPVHALYTAAARAIREADPRGLILREHDYFGNIGIPAAIPPLPDPAWVYSPHGYDLVVDTAAMPQASDTRVTMIFERAAETGEGLGVPVIVGEWGAFATHEGIARHADAQLELFDARAWSWFYWCWEPGFATTEAAARLRRPRPRAVAGRDLRAGTSAGGGWRAAWTGRDCDAPSEFWIPPEREVEHLVDGRRQELRREHATVLLAPGAGEHRLRVS